MIQFKKIATKVAENIYIAVFVVGTIFFALIIKNDIEYIKQDKKNVVNLLLTTTPKLLYEGEYIKIFGLINNFRDHSICIYNEQQNIIAKNINTECTNSDSEVFQLIHDSKVFGTLLIKKDINLYNRVPIYSSYIILLVALIFLMLYLKSKNNLNKTISFIVNSFVNQNFVNTKETPDFFDEKLLTLYNALVDHKKNLDALTLLKEENHKKTVIYNLSTQLSHDIRSPLAALEMASGSLTEIPEEKRQIIRNAIVRIRDIANSLLNKNRQSTLGEQTNYEHLQISKELSSTLLTPLLDTILTEKRIQYRSNIGIKIEFNQSKDSYNLFTKIEPNEFQRVISNLIDNSVEALAGKTGSIELTLKSNQSNQIELVIADNGKGIPADILPKLGNRGESFGKENGSGLGLFHAIETIQSFSGSLKIDSQLNKGTTVTILLPRVKEPAWFVPKIILSPDQTVIVFDDDQSIHQVWKGRIDSLFKDHRPTILNFSNTNDLRNYYRKNFMELENALFLMDYEISGSNETGLDLIESLGIQKQSLLVTSRYEEKHIREHCEKLNIKLIPKPMCGFVPMEALSNA